MTGACDHLRAAWDARLDGLEPRVSLQLRSGGVPVAGRAAEAPHYAASTIKLAVLGAWLEAGRTGALLVHPDFASAVGGRFEVRQADDQDDDTWAAVDSVVAAEALAARMIQASGNLATDLLVEDVGLASVAAFLERSGLGGSISMGRLIGDAAAETAGITNTVTAAGLAELLAGLVDGSLLRPAASAAATTLLAGQQHRNLIPAGLPEGTWTASKSGWVPGVRHDVALVRPGGTPEYVLAACTTGLGDEQAETLIRDLSRITYEEWTRWHG